MPLGTRGLATLFVIACVAVVGTAVVFVSLHGRRERLTVQILSPAGLSVHAAASPAPIMPDPRPPAASAEGAPFGNLSLETTASTGAKPPPKLAPVPPNPALAEPAGAASDRRTSSLSTFASQVAPRAPSSAEAQVAALEPAAALPAATPVLTPVQPPPTALSGPTNVPRAVFNLPASVPGEARHGGLAILQIGDSHTAADFFSGEVRQLLQAKFGDGGIGYLNAGKPHPGVRSAVVKVNASPGWTYAALQKASDTDQFYLSGFNASVTGGGETLAFSARDAAPFDMIEVEAIFGPGRGGLKIAIDDLPPIEQSLAAQQTEKRVFRVTPSSRDAAFDFRKLTIATTGGGPVTIASVGVFNRSYGVSYSAIGFPGATIDIVNQINSRLFGEELRRLDPQVVVLAFGTNEGFNDGLDLGRYTERYRTVLRKIRDSLPQARVVIVGPPNGNRLPGRCKGEGAGAACKPPGGDANACTWSTPPMLDKVREAQRRIASEDGLTFWNWGEITPGSCGAHALVNATPHLMAPDHVHFTGEGYRLGAQAFARFLIPLVEQMKSGGDAVSNR